VPRRQSGQWTGGGAYLWLSQQDWEELGEKAGWNTPDPQFMNIDPQKPFKLEVRKYSEKTWGLYLNGELLAVVQYKKGAMALTGLLDQLWQQIAEQEGKLSVLMRELDVERT
jgi:hypothetical protein